MQSSALLDPRQGPPTINADLRGVAQGLHEEFDERMDPQVVEECVKRVAASYDGATVRSFVPLLVRRYARDELKTRRPDDAAHPCD